MRTLAALSAFALTQAIILVISNLVSVYLINNWEPFFGSQRDNVVAFLEAVPFLVGVTSVSFAVGLNVSATFKQFSNRTAAAKVGVVSAIVTNLALGLVIAVEVAGGFWAEGTEGVVFIGGPCLGAVVAAILVERRSGGLPGGTKSWTVT